MNLRHRFLLAFAIIAIVGSAQAGYEAPCHIDGCQSADGRFVVTAEHVEGSQIHGPHQWRFVWKDTQDNKTISVDAKGIQKGQIYAQLFLAPDGETFALFNHVTLWSADKSHMHGPSGLRTNMGTPEWKTLEEFSNRIIVYRKDGTIIKALSINDIVTEKEWAAIGPMFNRMEWLKEYDELPVKQIVRPTYAYCRVSPDYTILEVTVKPTKDDKARTGRAVRISLTDGKVLDPTDWPTAKEKAPVPCYVGEIKETVLGKQARERYQPSLDPVRQPGKLLDGPAPAPTTGATTPAPQSAAPPKLELVKSGFTKLDTPAWLPKENGLLITDLEQKKLWRVDLPDKWTVLREEACRGKVASDGRFYGILGGKLASWRPGEEPKVIIEKATGGRPIELNDIAVGSNGFLYFTTLKDPEVGRLSVVNIQKQTVAVAFDAAEADLPNLANPNGVALSPDGQFLYVGISNYKNRKFSGVYRFPIQPDGSLDVAAGKGQKWAAVASPDGITVGPDGHVYFTASPVVVIASPEGKKVSEIKIPKGSGTNLTFGGEDGRTLFVTTNDALYFARMEKR